MSNQIKKQFVSYAEAIRAGIPLGRQTFDRWGGSHGSSCVLGAGLRAIDLPASAQSATQVFLKHYPYMIQPRTVRCPRNCNGGVGSDLRDAAMHLNDYHRWTREAIADWLYEREEEIGFLTLVENEPVTCNTKELARNESEVFAA